MMRSRVSALTSAYPFRARETVPIETPLALASWRIVIRSSLISENGFGNRCGSVFTGAAGLSRGAGWDVCHGLANVNTGWVGRLASEAGRQIREHCRVTGPEA